MVVEVGCHSRRRRGLVELRRRALGSHELLLEALLIATAQARADPDKAIGSLPCNPVVLAYASRGCCRSHVARVLRKSPISWQQHAAVLALHLAVVSIGTGRRGTVVKALDALHIRSSRHGKRWMPCSRVTGSRWCRCSTLRRPGSRWWGCRRSLGSSNLCRRAWITSEAYSHASHLVVRGAVLVFVAHVADVGVLVRV